MGMSGQVLYTTESRFSDQSGPQCTPHMHSPFEHLLQFCACGIVGSLEGPYSVVALRLSSTPEVQRVGGPKLARHCPGLASQHGDPTIQAEGNVPPLGSTCSQALSDPPSGYSLLEDCRWPCGRISICKKSPPTLCRDYTTNPLPVSTWGCIILALEWLAR
jgi:hypothetical protein